MSEKLPFRQSATAGCLSAGVSILAVLPLSTLYLLFQRSQGEDFTMLILWLNAPLIALLWALPLWFWLRRTRPQFAFGWLCAHLAGALINGACLTKLMVRG
jgi:hypothetical protein